MINGTVALDPTTLKAVADTAAAAGTVLAETAQNVITNENAQSMLSGIFQTITDNTPAVVSEAWNAVAGENPYVAAGVAAATGIALVAGGLFMCRRTPAKASKADESKFTAESSSLVASSSQPSSSDASNDNFSAEGEVGEKKSRSRSPSPTRRAVGDE